ncbi:hypothetical protein PUMCH_003982 [Australozyma saopauloensis]|uniref:Endosomal/vacuolar adapter protein YPT35 n=1 Tax=Australozyma saopauloensis TaxID=291208 RepID=A0AAX4HDD6_9ASCO|nr:hypothetical protein PUMCH_003982 [[Candida] saopauloensis]
MTAPKKALKPVAPVPISLVEGALDHSHFSASSHITDVLVGEYHNISGDGLSASYIAWSIRIVVDDAMHSLILIYKRYRDLEELRRKLAKAFSNEDIPELPPKDNLSVQRICGLDLWLEHRRKGLQWFLTNVLLNPKFQHHEIITDFVLG